MTTVDCILLGKMAEDDDSEGALVLTKHALFGFGFSFVGGSQDALPLVIADILDGSPADLCGQVCRTI